LFLLFACVLCLVLGLFLVLVSSGVLCCLRLFDVFVFIVYLMLVGLFLVFCGFWYFGYFLGLCGLWCLLAFLVFGWFSGFVGCVIWVFIAVYCLSWLFWDVCFCVVGVLTFMWLVFIIVDLLVVSVVWCLFLFIGVGFSCCGFWVWWYCCLFG